MQKNIAQIRVHKQRSIKSKHWCCLFRITITSKFPPKAISDFGEDLTVSFGLHLKQYNKGYT